MTNISYFGFLFCVLGPIFVISAPVLSNLLLKKVNAYKQQRRGEQFSGAADQLSWTFKELSHNIPIETLQKELYLFEEIKRDMILISNVISGEILSQKAYVFDFQNYYYIGRGQLEKRITLPKTFLLIDISPNNSPHFWLTTRSGADEAMLEKGLITGILASNFMIQGPDKQALQEIFTQEAISHYENKKPTHLRAKGRWILISIAKNQKSTASKEHVLDLIAEGKHVLNLLNLN